MKLRIRLSSSGLPEILSERRVLLSDLDVELPGLDRELDQPLELAATAWKIVDRDAEGRATCLRSTILNDDGPIATAEIRSFESHVSFAVTIHETLSGLHVEDTFEACAYALPRFHSDDRLRSLATTYGLGPSGGGGAGGYWPDAVVADRPAELPSKAFAPMILFDEHEALAVVPADHFLTSALLADQGIVRRTLHGSIDRLPAGTRIETLFAWGGDLTTAMMNAGNLLLARGGKQRPDPARQVLTSTPGWWNAYGAYYTEPIHALDAMRLAEVVESLQRQQVPIGYLGLDLWYPYKEIGQAFEFTPNLEKYPDGIGTISRRFGLPTVLHLSALCGENAYHADGSDPTFYGEVAQELLRHGAVTAWHDWLRTQQHLTPKLRNDTDSADGWFSGMAHAMGVCGIDVLTCMHTMGMILASTALPSIVAARSSIDYLFSQPEALDTLERIGLGGFRNEAISLPIMRRQNLLVGFIYYTLGLLPFYDLFLTRWHTEIGGHSPRTEAVLRALSCGPVGIGDGPGMTDVDLVRSLVSSSRKLLQPDHPPYPDADTLGSPIEIYRTEHRAGLTTWRYVLALNTTSHPQTFDLPMPSEDVVIWDGMRGEIVPRMSGSLPAGEIAYYVLFPRAEGIAPFGVWEKIVPAPASVIEAASWNRGWHVNVRAPGDSFAIHAVCGIDVSDQEGRLLPQESRGSLTVVPLDETISALHITRR